MPLLQLQHVTKRFGGLVAVDDVSFAVDSGELVAIAGPNGAGKTTLFNLISGMLEPDEGSSIVFDSVELTALPPHRRAHLGVARTFQIPRPFGSATVRDNVAIGAMFGAMVSKISVAEAFDVADRYLEMVGLVSQRLEQAGRLTPVERKRMELARALAMKPKLLLLDEVMAGMNPNVIDEMVELLLAIRDQEQLAVIGLVEHIMRAVAGLAERVIVMHQGALFLDAPTREALTDPRVVEIYLGRPAGEHDAGG